MKTILSKRIFDEDHFSPNANNSLIVTGGEILVALRLEVSVSLHG